MSGGDIEEAEFVGGLRIVDPRLFDRIARILQLDEVHALHHAPAGDVEAGNDAAGDGPLGCLPATAIASFSFSRSSSRARPVITPSISSEEHTSELQSTIRI